MMKALLLRMQRFNVQLPTVIRARLLAASCIPVVNDAVHNRIVLDNAFIRYVPPYPRALASELEALVTAGDFESLSRAAAATVQFLDVGRRWAAVDRIFRRTLEANPCAGLITPAPSFA
jgi:hypothetical protein